MCLLLTGRRIIVRSVDFGSTIKARALTLAATGSGPTPPRAPSGEGGVVYRRVTRGLRQRALAMLLTGRAQADASAVNPLLSFADDQHLSLDELWMAAEGDEPKAVMLIVPGVGRTGMAFLSPIFDGPDSDTITNLARVACQTQDANQMRLIQVLLDPHQDIEIAALAGAGFTKLAQLLYMECDIEAGMIPLELDEAVTCLHWSRRTNSCFKDIILASYQDTLDCPGLVGLRHIDDILAGHMAVGVFKPELWFALHAHGEPVAVMLLNLASHGAVMELVYLGVAPGWRGRGVGRKLLAHGLGLASQYGATSMALAVDRINKPALHLYRSMHFTSTSRRQAMIYVLDDLEN